MEPSKKPVLMNVHPRSFEVFSYQKQDETLKRRQYILPLESGRVNSMSEAFHSEKGNRISPRNQFYNPQAAENHDILSERSLPATIVKMVLTVCQTVFQSVKGGLSKLLEVLMEPHFLELVQETKIYMSNHPAAAVILGVVAFTCGIPVIIFVAFAITTIFLTFSGFLIIEGAVLAAGLLALLVCLATMAVMLTMVGFVGGLTYITCMHIASIINAGAINGGQTYIFDAQLPQVLATLRNLSSVNQNFHQGQRRTQQSSASVHVHHSK